MMLQSLLVRSLPRRVISAPVRTFKRVGADNPEEPEIPSVGKDDLVIETSKQEETLDSAVTKDDTPYGTTRDVEAGNVEKSLNQVFLIGRVGADPVMRGSVDRPVLTFSLATNTSWKSPGNDNWTHRTDWHNVCIFNKALRERVYQYVGKGHRLHVTGKITYGEIVDKAGIRRHTTSIFADDVVFIDAKTKQ